MRPISIILIVCQILLYLPNLYASTTKQEMNITSIKDDMLVGNKGKKDGIEVNSIFVIARQSMYGEIIIGKAKVRIVKENACGLEVTELDPNFDISKNDKLMELDKSAYLYYSKTFNNNGSSPYNMNLDDIKLVPDKEKYYNEQKLSIKIAGMDPHSIPNHEIDSKTAKSKKWQAYQGDTEISEQELLNIAGLEEKSNKVAMHANGNIIQSMIGVVMGIYGISVTLSSNDKNTSGEPAADMRVLGLALCGLGAGMTYIGVSHISKKSLTFRTADQIAQKYNQELKFNLLFN